MFTKNSSLTSSIAQWLVLTALVLSVVLVLPFTENFLFTTKLYLFFVVTILMGFAFTLHSLQKKTIEFVLSPFTMPVILFGVAIACSTFFTNSYPVEGLLNLGGLFLSTVLFILFASTLITKDLAEKIIPAAGIAGALLTLFSVSQMLGYGPAQLFNQLFKLKLDTSSSFNLLGQPFYALQFVGIVLLGMIVQTISTKNISKLTAILFPILLCGVAVFGYSILPGKPGNLPLPSWTASWSVALDTIRSPRSALIGGGIASYGNLYNRYKPLWMNSTPNWGFSYTQASNVPLTLLTTAGFFGLITWLVLIYQSFRVTRQATGTNLALGVMLLVSFALQVLFPTHIVILIFQAILIVGMIAAHHGKLPILRFQALTMTMDTQPSILHMPTQRVSFPVYLISGALALGLLFSGYLVVRAYSASAYFLQAAMKAQDNDLAGVFDKQQRAVDNNPLLDLYRRQYAITSMMVATVLAGKTDITEPEKGQVAQYLQLSVREARSAALLDPQDSENLAVLAEIYRNMIGVADQADQFAVQSYVEAIQNDPTNPALRLSLGGMLLGQQNATEAASIFRQTIDIKPDYPDSYYQLAVALNVLGAYKDAEVVYQELLKLIPSDNPQYAQVNKELTDLQAKIKQLEAKQPRSTTTATPAPSSAPSLLNQTLNEKDTDVVNTPATEKTETDLGTQLKTTTTPTPAP